MSSPGRKLPAIAAALLLAGPALAGNTPVQESRVLRQCPWISSTPGIHTIASAEAWHALLPFTQTEEIFTQAPDWTRERVLILSLGARPNAGYSLELASSRLLRPTRTLEVQVRELPPKAGELHAQVIVQPCALLRVTTASWQHVIMRDAGQADAAPLASASSQP